MFCFSDSEYCPNCGNIFVFVTMATLTGEQKNIITPVNAIKCPYCSTKMYFDVDTQSWKVVAVEEITNE